MYQRVGEGPTARAVEGAAGRGPEEEARRALARVRQLLTGYAPGARFDRARLQEALAVALPEDDQEAERLFALGWLRWLGGEWVPAEPLLAAAGRRAQEVKVLPLLAESAYWRGRVGVLLGRAEALADYEGVLKSLGGSPRATAWYVDLLWRGGRVDRAEQVWKSVRGNRRVTACDEGPLLEARSLLRRGELAAAERLLTEPAPAGGVAWVERRLLLAWTVAAQGQRERALALLDEAEQGPYPPEALESWRVLVERRGQKPAVTAAEAGRIPEGLKDYVRGQQARQEGHAEEAAAAYRAALAGPVQAFARHGLACLGRDDFAALLAAQPGLFLAIRCRARLALDRFSRRQVAAAECLDALKQAVVAGYRDATTEHFRRLAAVMQQREPDAEGLRSLAAGPGAGEGPAARNFFRAALEQALRRLPPAATRELLVEWARSGTFAPGGERANLLARALLRPLMSEPDGAETLAAVEGLLPPQGTTEGGPPPALRLAAVILGPSYREAWQAARDLSAGGEAWRERVQALRSNSRLRPLAQGLLLQEAARRGDVATAAALLEDADAWRGFGAAPPPFVLRAVESLASARPAQPSLARWLRLWDPAALGESGARLLTRAGLTPERGDSAEPPAGAVAAPWFLHQASRALGRDDAIEALAFTRRALAADPDLTSVPDADVVRSALPELERRAHAQGLAALVRSPEEPAPPSGLLAGLVDLLADTPEAREVLDAVGRGDQPLARKGLLALADRPDLASTLLHHLALLEWRLALAAEGQNQAEAADVAWRCSWRCWLRFLAASSEATRGLVLEHLLGFHRGRVNDLLGQSAVDRARRHWNLVQDLPLVAGRVDEALGRDLAVRGARFREELATDYLVTTREAMRYGEIPEGWRADYEKGLAHLRRLLSLDRDSVRLLTALAQTCAEWFLDLYNTEDAPRLRAQVERFTPFALQLARLVQDRPADLAARAALADFYKFRGFVAADRSQKAALYREALRFNPANTNVRDLLADLEAPDEHQTD